MKVTNILILSHFRLYHKTFFSLEKDFFSILKFKEAAVWALIISFKFSLRLGVRMGFLNFNESVGVFHHICAETRYEHKGIESPNDSEDCFLLNKIPQEYYGGF
jgi:hypothetical protein